MSNILRSINALRFSFAKINQAVVITRNFSQSAVRHNVHNTKEAGTNTIEKLITHPQFTKSLNCFTGFTIIASSIYQARILFNSGNKDNDLKKVDTPSDEISNTNTYPVFYLFPKPHPLGDLLSTQYPANSSTKNEPSGYGISS